MSWTRVDDGEDVSEFTKRFKRRAKFLIDENVIADVTQWLKSEGWNVRNVFDLGLAGHDDHAVFQAARDQGRMLITHDDDFFDNRRFPLQWPAQ
jgi:predicted nuclease of predicted toxin-antitoxin system